eukprot:TRINITY_DN2969_c0_g1_i1.p1 TRINITY_DN2969_c0_g1~~TRINITY_DN2969_c0_g1_i1.p1  ORF type:complete len:446 (+),score=86.46 TRINITY_DN2969_c0_g1_i1:846-2183(+)
MNEQAYWPSEQTIVADAQETSYRQSTNTANAQSVSNGGYTQKSDLFLGTDDPTHDRTTQIGVHALVYRNPTSNQMVIAIQGFYSDADFIMAVYWWKEWFIQRQAEKSIEKWVALGGNEKDVTGRENVWANQYRRAAVDAYARAKRSSIEEGLAASNMSRGLLGGELYFAVARQIVDDARFLYPTTPFTLTGHSFGGALASLVSMWLNSQFDLIVDTPVFGSPGVGCLARTRFGKYIYPEKSYSQIVNYVNGYDVITYIDNHPGRVCEYRLPAQSETNPSETHPGITACGKLMGRGLSLLTAFQDSEVSGDFAECRRYAHSIYSFQRYFVDNTVLSADGETPQGCGSTLPQTDCQWASLGLYVAFIFLHVFIVSVLFFFILLCIRKYCCIIICRQEDTRLMPCDCCYAADSDLEEDDIEGGRKTPGTKSNQIHPETDGVPLNEYPS